MFLTELYLFNNFCNNYGDVSCGKVKQTLDKPFYSLFLHILSVIHLTCNSKRAQIGCLVDDIACAL